MKLYEINNAIESVLNGSFYLDEQTGEIFDDSSLDELKIAYNDKLEGCALYIKNLEAEIDAITTEEKNLQARRKSKENKVEHLKNYILESMEKTNTPKVETAKVAVAQRNSKYVDIIDGDKIPNMYVVEKVERRVDKKSIAQALKNGEKISGAELKNRVTLTIK